MKRFFQYQYQVVVMTSVLYSTTLSLFDSSNMVEYIEKMFSLGKKLFKLGEKQNFHIMYLMHI